MCCCFKPAVSIALQWERAFPALRSFRLKKGENYSSDHTETQKIHRVKTLIEENYRWHATITEDRHAKQGKSLSTVFFFHHQKAKVQRNPQIPVIYNDLARFIDFNQPWSSYSVQESLLLRKQLFCLYLIGTATAPAVSVECPWM